MKYEEIKGRVKKNDLVEIKTKFKNILEKCLIVYMSKDMVKVAMILEENEVAAVSPLVAIPYDLLLEINKIDNRKLLFYSNLNNLHIERAIVSKNNNRESNAKI